MNDTAPMTWTYVAAAVGFAVSLPVGLLVLRAVQVAVTRAIRSHTDTGIAAPSNVTYLPTVAERERSST